jgi:hypothetical protein
VGNVQPASSWSKNTTSRGLPGLLPGLLLLLLLHGGQSVTAMIYLFGKQILELL